MIVTKEFLENKKACSEGLSWVIENNLIDLEAKDFLNKLIEADKLEWANWLIVRVMERKQYLAYSIFAAEQVIDIYEKKYPENKKPRLAIEAAKKVLEDDSKENRAVAAYAYASDVAYASGASAYAYAAAAYAYASDAAYVAYASDAAYVASYAYASDSAAYAYAAYVASYAAYVAYASDAAYASDSAAYAYAAAVYAYAVDARKEMRIRILNYGISLLEEEK